MMSTEYEVFDFPEIKRGPEKPLVLGPAGEVFDFVQTGESNGGKYLFSKLTVPPHVGPPPHIHHRTDEWFYAPNGGFSIFMGPTEFPDLDVTPGNGAEKETVTMLPMRPKELLYVPRNYTHGFVNTSNVNQEMWLVWSPDTPESSILPYFMNAGKVVTSKQDITEPEFLSRIRLVTKARDYGINQSADFWDFVKHVVEDKPEWLPSDRRATLLNLIHDEIESQA